MAGVQNPPNVGGGASSFTADQISAIMLASAPSGSNPFVTATAAPTLVYGLVPPAAVAGYATVGVGATPTDIAGPVPGYKLTATNAAGNSIKARTSVIPAGDFDKATYKWRLRAITTLENYTAYGLDLNNGLTPHAAFVIEASTSVVTLQLIQYTNTTTYGSTPFTALLRSYLQSTFLPGDDVWLGITRVGTALTFWFSKDGANDWILIFTSNDTTDLGLSSTPTAIGPMLDTNTSTAGTSILVVTSSPAP